MWFATERTTFQEPTDTDTAVERYVDEKETELADATIVSHRSRLRQFVRWCEEQEIDILNDPTGRPLHEYGLRDRNEGDLSKASE